MGNINVPVGSASFAKGNQSTSSQITLKNQSGINFKVNSGEYVFMNHNSELILDTPEDIINDRSFTSLIDVSPKQTQSSARPRMLTNKWLVTMAYDGINYGCNFYVSKNGGLTWYNLCNVDGGSSNQGNFMSMTTVGNIVHFVVGHGNNLIAYGKFDAETQSNVNIWSTTSTIMATPTSLQSCSIASNSSGHLTIAVSARDATYTTSFNIRSAKSTDGGVTWTKQNGTAGFDQITTQTVPGQNAQNVVVVYKPTGEPVIFYELNEYIVCRRWTGSAWSSQVNIIYITSHMQYKPSAAIDSYGTIHAVWHGTDNVDTSAYNIFYSQSTDGGATWPSVIKLTSGNTRNKMEPTITIDNNNQLHVLWVGYTTATPSYRQVEYIKTTNDIFGAITTLTNHSTDIANNPTTCDNHRNFEKPITVWKGSTLVFYGKWTVSNSPQYIPSITTAINPTVIMATGTGVLKSSGSVPKKYNGFKSKTNLGFI